MNKQKQAKNPFAKFMKLCIKAGGNELLNDKALRELQNLEQEHEFPPNVLVAKGTCIQLGSGATGYTLKDAEAAYKEALQIDPDNLEALIEIGYYYNCVQNRPAAAKPYFKKALLIAGKQLSVAICAMAECVSETDSPRKGLAFIQKIVKTPIDSKAVNKTLSDIKKLM